MSVVHASNRKLCTDRWSLRGYRGAKKATTSMSCIAYIVCHKELATWSVRDHVGQYPVVFTHLGGGVDAVVGCDILCEWSVSSVRLVASVLQLYKAMVKTIRVASAMSVVVS